MRFEKFRPKYTVTDYNQWEGNWELIEGIPYAMSPSPVHRHQQLMGVLYRHIAGALERKGDGCGSCSVIFDLDWIIAENTIVRPDIAVICHTPKDFITQPPVLIIEILSPATALKDRNIKFEIYQEQKVPYYILADPATKTHSVFQLVKGRYQEQVGLTDFTIHNDCNIQLDVAEALAAI